MSEYDRLKEQKDAIVTRDEAVIREDERQACWEDFIQVIRNAIKDSPNSFELKALHEAVYLMGWKELGTGDGKPMHKRANSAVSEWRADV
jgi:hypothetical protein